MTEGSDVIAAKPRKKSRVLKVLKWTVLIFILAIGIFAVIVALQPADYTVSRSLAIDAPADRVFAQVNDFHNWDKWSPWARLDPAAKNSFEGPPAGTGAIFKWSGNDKIGEGAMLLTDAHPNDRVQIKIDFERPFKDTSTAEFTFKPQDGKPDKTLVTWSMSGHKNFISKAVCMFMDMDKMLGGEFEKGLSQLKVASESPTTPPAAK